MMILIWSTHICHACLETCSKTCCPSGWPSNGTSSNPGNGSDLVPDISGALLKAVLIASAEFMDGGNLTKGYRFNNEQGYGFIKLDNALPLEIWPASVPGLIVTDGDTSGGANDINGLTGDVNVLTGESDTGTFEVCDTTQPLRVALAWIEASGENLNNDLNLRLTAPSGKVYYGNYFTDDTDRDGNAGPTETCPPVTGSDSTTPDSAAWSLPTCPNSTFDSDNPTEAIMLSPDYNGDGEADLDPTDDDLECNSFPPCDG